MPLLGLHGIRKSFPGVQALGGVDLAVQPGSVHALVGENGAGKSTLVRILAGIVRPDAGRIEVDGREVAIPDARAARHLGIAVVHQELCLAPDLSVGENVLLGRWPTNRIGLVDRRALGAGAAALLARLGSRLDPARPLRGTTVAERQQVEIARALADEARILVLDEPSAVLTPRELEGLFGIIGAMRESGAGIIYISHRLEEIFAIADTVTVLRDGMQVATHATAEVDRGRLVAAMVGRDLLPPPERGPSPSGEPVLRVENLAAGRRFRDVGFTVRRGEIFALAGLVGSGRSSVLQALFGAVRATAGRVVVDGVPGPFARPADAIAAGVAYLPEDRRAQGLLLQRSSRENVALASLRRFARRGFIDARRERSAVAALLDEMQVRPRDPEVTAGTLSGGNQQKLLLARWMGRAHGVVLLDEPTRGVDVGAKQEIHALMTRLAAEGAAVVLASSELPEVIALAHRIGVMRAGCLAGIVDNAAHDVSQETLLEMAS